MLVKTISKGLRARFERLRRLPSDRSGVTAIEYTLIAVAIALAIAAAMSASDFPTKFSETWNEISAKVSLPASE